MSVHARCMYVAQTCCMHTAHAGCMLHGMNQTRGAPLLVLTESLGYDTAAGHSIGAGCDSVVVFTVWTPWHGRRGSWHSRCCRRCRCGRGRRVGRRYGRRQRWRSRVGIAELARERAGDARCNMHLYAWHPACLSMHMSICIHIRTPVHLSPHMPILMSSPMPRHI